MAMKKGQDGKSIILRLVEVEGMETEAKVKLASELLTEDATVVEVDTLERPLDVNNARLEGNILIVKLSAYGISTVCIS